MVNGIKSFAEIDHKTPDIVNSLKHFGWFISKMNKSSSSAATWLKSITSAVRMEGNNHRRTNFFNNSAKMGVTEMGQKSNIQVGV